MKLHNHFMKDSSLRATFSFGLAVALASAGTLAVAKVQPPPLPPGSNMVRVKAGMNDDEIKRQVRAHHNKTHFKKDLAKDDSIPGNGKTNEGKKP